MTSHHLIRTRAVSAATTAPATASTASIVPTASLSRLKRWYALLVVSLMLLLLLVIPTHPVAGRTKLVALPDRATTIIRLDHPAATLIEEERVLTLQQGVNKVDFSWNGVNIDVDSIRLMPLSHPDSVRLLNVSFPPNEDALVWEIASDEPVEERVRISYLLNQIDRLITYKAVADKQETHLEMKSFVVLRNFSGEDFANAEIVLDYGQGFEQSIQHEGTKKTLFYQADKVPITKIWTFDATKLPWDPELEDDNVGIPVTYRFENNHDAGLGRGALWPGKVRLFQHDGHGSTLFLGEDRTELVPVGEDTELTIGDSRDIVVTQRKMEEKRVNIRRNSSGRDVLWDVEEVMTVEVENFKDSPAVLTLIEEIPGQWQMTRCNMDYTRTNATTIEFEISLKPSEKKTLQMEYKRVNVRPGITPLRVPR